MRFPANIKALRTYRGWSQEELAGMLGIARSRYAGWELGVSEPSLYHLNALQELHGVGADVLLRADFKGYSKEALGGLIATSGMQPRPRIVKP